jgi:predicted AAA+ superfamily ATPase
MDILDYFLDLKPMPDPYFPRKLHLPEDGSFFLYGARATGKTSLILNHLQHYPPDSWLYLDAQDPAFALEDIDVNLLEDFLREEEISLLVIDHWYPGFLERLPQNVRLILVSRLRDPSLPLDSYELFPLDYEEFLSFDKSAAPIQAFNHFIKVGTLPSLALESPTSAILRMRELFYAMFDDQESRLLLILARFQGRRISAHQIYTTAREYFRISKDWTYATLKRFEEEKLIFLLPDLHKGPGKKLILYDFVFTRYLNKYQPFPATFDAMVALALIKHARPFVVAGSLGYRLSDHEELIVPSPFEGSDQFWKRAQQRYTEFKETGAKKMWIVTVSNRYKFRIGAIEFEAIPFYEWSIINED